VFAFSPPVEKDPLVDWLPDHAPDAAQEVAFVDDQDNIDAEPLATVLGFALRLTVAVGCALTVTVADWDALPPLPVQVRV
jgi:hypothetical protein